MGDHDITDRAVEPSRGRTRRVAIAGELDLQRGERLVRRCARDHSRDVEVDLSELTFLDCGGYRALVVARRRLAEHGRTLTLVGAVGEPRRLLDTIAERYGKGSSC